MLKPAFKDPVLRYLPMDLPEKVSIGMHRLMGQTAFTGTLPKPPIRLTGAVHDSKRSSRKVTDSRSVRNLDPLSVQDREMRVLSPGKDDSRG